MSKLKDVFNSLMHIIQIHERKIIIMLMNVINKRPPEYHYTLLRFEGLPLKHTNVPVPELLKLITKVKWQRYIYRTQTSEPRIS